jgi:hypothetical protein
MKAITTLSLASLALLFALATAFADGNGGPQGGGPGNSGNGDKNSCVEGPPPGPDPSCG